MTYLRGIARFVVIGMTVSTVYVKADSVPTAYQHYAEKHNVPPSILYAIALAESGHSVTGVYRPWPWSLNIKGKSLRYKTAEEIAVALHEVLARGDHADIGVMQINSYWHKNRVSIVNDFLNPHTNVDKGAEILSEQRQRSDDWWEAVGRYHAPGNDQASLKRAERYRQRVKALYKKYIKRKLS